jgi:SAM-dependent methyltransferase
MHHMYSDLAEWFHLLTAPADYAFEAGVFRDAILAASDERPRTLLELGSGGGNNASHLKHAFTCTLTDLSPPMLALSATINPECEHLPGDMRTLRLGRTFDAVLIHDAIVYMLDERDLRAAMETAFVHLRPGGVAVFVPDYVRETFRTGTDHGGHDGADGRGMRYLEWVHEPEPSGTTYTADYAYVLRDRDGTIRTVHDRHVASLFPRATWLSLLRDVGFEVRATVPHAEDQHGDLFVAVRPR